MRPALWLRPMLRHGHHDDNAVPLFLLLQHAIVLSVVITPGEGASDAQCRRLPSFFTAFGEL